MSRSHVEAVAGGGSRGADPGSFGRMSGAAALGTALLAAAVTQSQATLERPPARLVGDRMVAGFPGTSPPRELLRAIGRGQLAGVIVFSRNIRSPRQLASLAARLQAARPSGDPPLLVMVDQEGGLVKRLPGPPRHSPAEIGQTGDPAVARHEGAATGRSLKASGVNVNLAPVLDLGRRGSNTARLGRSFSSRPDVVSSLGVAFARGLAAAGVAATAKHFPGLGGARRDEDRFINRIALSLSTLRARDEAPFAAAVQSGAVPLVMVSTAVYPALDSRPALFSPRIATTELRERLGFGGVSITDDLEVPAALRFGSPARRGRLATRAGIDLLLFARNYRSALAAGRALVDDLQHGRVDRAQLAAASARVLALRGALGGPG